ncbi:hypothetical protein MNBD_ACTINO02-2104 [hydrothermal vent metagenome]|uniref:Peptidase M10 metallopeptidase domain-containing protein n=1 Tax=hydrothermal vent metagenome TaxID=652676 RepID=A0A3B0SUC3_9ZZZZ
MRIRIRIRRHKSPDGRLIRPMFFLAAFLAVLMLIPAVTSGTASASHNRTPFPTYGLLDMSSRRNYSGNLYIATDNCNWQQRSAFTIVKNSTDGQTYMDRWPNGIKMQEYVCYLSSSNYVDLSIEYKDQQFFAQGGGYYIGGRNVPLVAPSSFCSFWNTTYPCGQRPRVEINEDKYAANSSTYKKRLIMHETGHSLGLKHHCSGNSIMNNGASWCNGGKWTSLNPMEYWPTDRLGISQMYPDGA